MQERDGLKVSSKNCGVGEDSWESLTPRRSNQSILKEINPEYSLEGLMLKLKLQSFGHLMHWANSSVKILMLGSIEGKGRKGATEDEMVRYHHWLNGHEFERSPGDSEGQGSLACCSPWGCQEPDTTYQLNNNNTAYSGWFHTWPRRGRLLFSREDEVKAYGVWE